MNELIKTRKLGAFCFSTWNANLVPWSSQRTDWWNLLHLWLDDGTKFEFQVLKPVASSFWLPSSSFKHLKLTHLFDVTSTSVHQVIINKTFRFQIILKPLFVSVSQFVTSTAGLYIPRHDFQFPVVSGSWVIFLSREKRQTHSLVKGKYVLSVWKIAVADAALTALKVESQMRKSWHRLQHVLFIFWQSS